MTIDGDPVEGLVHAGPAVIAYRAEAPAEGLGLTITVELLPSGLVRAKAELTNLGETVYRLAELTVNLPVPNEAREILDFGGRWGNERTVQRGVLNQGAHRRESRFGRTGANSAYVLNLGTAGFGYREGEVWGVHTAFSGNHIHQAQRDYLGANLLGGGLCCLAREIWPPAGPMPRRGSTSTTRVAWTARRRVSTVTCDRFPCTRKAIVPLP